MKALILILTLFASASSYAEFEKHEPLQVDFNRMIEAGSRQNNSMKEELHDKGFGDQRAEALKASKKRVTDLIDVEIGWGAPPKIVDRRYDSVSEPRVVLIPMKQIK